MEIDGYMSLKRVVLVPLLDKKMPSRSISQSLVLRHALSGSGGYYSSGSSSLLLFLLEGPIHKRSFSLGGGLDRGFLL